MQRLDRLIARRARWLVAAWLIAVAACLPFALRSTEHLTAGGFAIDSSQSAHVERELAAQLPAKDRAVVLGAVLVRGPRWTQADVARAFDDVARAVARTPGVRLRPMQRTYTLYEAKGTGRRPLVVSFVVDRDEYHAPDVAVALRDRLGLADGAHRVGDVSVHLVGQGAVWAALVDETTSDLHHAELIGFPLVLVVLLCVFGSLLAAAFPVAVGAAAIAVSGALIYALSLRTTVNVYATNTASMIGLGVAVDYSLFVLARFREELAAGSGHDTARATAMRTSGVAVLFSGATVVTSLLALLLVGSSAVRSMAFAAIVVVAVAVLCATTLVPALLALGGGRVRAPRRRAPLLTRSTGYGSSRWVAAIVRRPGRALGAALVVVLAVAAPALALKTGDGALRQFPADHEMRVGVRAAASVTGIGVGSPLKVVAPRSSAEAISRRVERDREVGGVSAPVAFADGRRAMFIAVPKHDGDSPPAKALVARLRRELPRGVQIGGNSAAQLDFDRALRRALAPIAVVLALLGFAVLLALLRAPVLALKAVATTLLSVAAAYGVLTAVFVWGWADALPHFQSHGYIDSIAVPLVLAVVFGLSMDYEVFLLTRIRERHLGGASTAQAVGEGIESSARTITGAAAVMVAVFASFVLTGIPVIQQIGLGAAVAIALDATLVRLVLAPAAMVLLGRRCWWTPLARG